MLFNFVPYSYIPYFLTISSVIPPIIISLTDSIERGANDLSMSIPAPATTESAALKSITNLYSGGGGDNDANSSKIQDVTFYSFTYVVGQAD